MPLSTDGSFLFLDPACDHEGCPGVLCEVGTPEFSPLDRSPISAAELEAYANLSLPAGWWLAAAVVRARSDQDASFGYRRHAPNERTWTFEPRDGAHMLAGETFPISDSARQALALRAIRSEVL